MENTVHEKEQQSQQQTTFELWLDGRTDLLAYGNIKSPWQLASVDVKQIDLFTSKINKQLVAVGTKCHVR